MRPPESVSCSGKTCLHSMPLTHCLLQVPAAASGLIAGDGMWTIPSCILSIVKVSPPLCLSVTGSAAAVAAAAPAAG